MAEVKVTEEILRAKNMSREKLLSEIRLYERYLEDSKTTPMAKQGMMGRISEKTIFLDESEVPDAFKPVNPDAPPKPISQKDILIAETEYIKAETIKIRAQIDYEVAKNERDKPETLVKKEAALNELDTKLLAKQDECDKRFRELDDFDKILKNREMELNNAKSGFQKEIIEERARVSRENKEKIDQVKLDIINLQTKINELNKNIESKKGELTQITESIETTRNEIQPIIDNIEKWISVAKKQAEQSHFISEDKRYPPNIRNYNQNKSNALWSDKDKLEGLKKKISKFLKGF